VVQMYNTEGTHLAYRGSRFDMPRVQILYSNTNCKLSVGSTLEKPNGISLTCLRQGSAKSSLALRENCTEQKLGLQLRAGAIRSECSSGAREI